MLIAVLDQAAGSLHRLAKALRAVSAAPVQITVDVAPMASAATDKVLADAVKRGQLPELLAALRKVQ